MTVRRHLRLLSMLLLGLAGAGLLTVGFGLTPLSGSVFGSMLGFGPKGDFSLSSGSPVTMSQGQTGTISATVTSIDHLSGDVSVTATLATSGNSPPVVATGQSSVKLNPDETASFSVTVLATSSTTLGYYNITVQGKMGNLSHSITVSAHVTPPPPPPTPDFSLSSSSTWLTTNQGTSVSTTLTVSSILSYSGNVALTATIYPSGLNSPSVSLNRSSLILPSGGSNITTMIVSTFNATVRTYSISITGISLSHTHTLDITLTVNRVVGTESLYLEFYSFTSTTSANLLVRNFGSMTTTLVSYYVADARGDKYTLSSWNGPVMSPNQLGNATILIGASCSGCVLSGSAFTFTSGNSYVITLVTRYGNQFSYMFTLSAQEALSLDSYIFPTGSSTNVTLYIRNTGSVSVQLSSYYVRDASGDTYALTSFGGPTIATNTVAAVTVTVGSGCPGCTVTGNPFTFTSGNSYTILFVTSRSNQFSFTVTK